MRYRAAAKIPAAWECNLLVVASAHLVLCQVGGGAAGPDPGLASWRGCSAVVVVMGGRKADAHKPWLQQESVRW
jgi:hypothetical protein